MPPFLAYLFILFCILCMEGRASDSCIVAIHYERMKAMTEVVMSYGRRISMNNLRKGVDRKFIVLCPSVHTQYAIVSRRRDLNPHLFTALRCQLSYTGIGTGAWD